MVKKITKYLLVVLGIGLLLFLVLHNIDSFVTSTHRLGEILKIDSLKNWFEVYNNQNTVIHDEAIQEIETNVNTIIENVEATSKLTFEEMLVNFLTNFANFSLDFFIYFCNYGLNAILICYMMLHETFTGEQERIKTSLFARFFIMVDSLYQTAKKVVTKAISYILEQVSYHRRTVALWLSLIFMANGFLYKLFVEFLIFIITYIIHVINLETYVVIFDVFKAVFTIVYPNLKLIPNWIMILAIIILVFLTAVSKATFKLKKNHERLKEFVKDDLTQTTFINGPPGTGKTLLNVSLSLASEENYIEELEKKTLDYELQFKYLNFAKIREEPDKYPEHSEYIENYKLITTRGTLIISNFAIYSPLYNEYSKIFDFNYMKVNIPQDVYPLEEYIVISLSEFDKEYNSHDNKKEVGAEGAGTFFSTVSHNLKRHVKIFADYQLKDQVPLRIRGNAEYFITIKDCKKKYPILLMLYYLPFLGLFKLTQHYIKKYEQKKERITRTSMRKGVAKYKRNDITLPYAFLRGLATSLRKICKWFDSFYYFKQSVIISQEGDLKGIKRKLCINIRDLTYKNQKIYDSTFLSFAYQQKKNKDFKELPRFTSLTPSQEELDLCNSRFYGKISAQNNQSQFDENEGNY